MTDPLILTLRFDPESFRRFDDLRRRYFPPARNQIPAHLTLFHKLPGEHYVETCRTLAATSASRPPFSLSIEGLRFLGYGSAYVVRSPELEALRAELASDWADRLTPQDAQRFAPHVTIQNKAPASEAKALFAKLRDEFAGFQATATGLLLWHYRGGPWEAAGEWAFIDASNEQRAP